MITAANSVLYTSKLKGLTTINDVEIQLDPKYNRKTLPDNTETSIEEVWQDRLKANPTLFNGTKFRLDSIEEKDKKLILNVGITCYKDFQGTNLHKDVLDLHSKGLGDHGNSQVYMSDALGVGGLLLTSDNYVVLLFRSKRCGEDIDLWDRPGGHPEPKTLVGSLSAEEVELSLLDPKAVVRELFESITNEVISEVNIPDYCLEKPKLLGIHRSNLNGGKPNAEFLVRCSLKAEEVKSLYKEGSQEEAYESVEIKFVPLDEALMAQTAHPDLWEKMAAGAKGTLLLYKLYIDFLKTLPH